MLPEYVKQAYELLRTSIIHVDSADVVLDDDEVDEARKEAEEAQVVAWLCCGCLMLSTMSVEGKKCGVEYHVMWQCVCVCVCVRVLHN